MNISEFSVSNALMWCCIVMFLFHLIMKSNRSIGKLGLTFLLLLGGTSIIRLILPLEFESTIVIGSRTIYPWVERTSDRIATAIAGKPMTSSRLIFYFCLAAAIPFLIRSITKYLKHAMTLRRFPSADARVQNIMNGIGRKKNLRVVSSPLVNVPQIMGFFRITIALPKKEYTDKQLRLILTHEWTHYKKADLWIKLVFEIFCDFMWWNPLAYLLKADIEQLLEIRCDNSCTRGISPAETAYYLETLRAQHLEASESRLIPFVRAAFVGVKPLSQRFIMIRDYKNHMSKRDFLLSLAGLITALLISYNITIQPHYAPPLGEGDRVIDYGYVEENSDGTYILRFSDGSSIEADDRILELLRGQKFDLRQ